MSRSTVRRLALLLACLLTLAATTGEAVPPARVAAADPVREPRGALAPAPASAGLLVESSARMRAPLPGASPGDVERAFSAPLRPWGRGHRGIDLAGSGMVVAPAAGIVTFAGVVVDRPVLSIAHPDGTVSSFEPVVTALKPGTPVLPGQPIAWVAPGLPHCAVPCLHWGVRRAGAWQVGGAVFDRYLDPLWLIGWSGPSVLWPQDREPPPPLGPG